VCPRTPALKKGENIMKNILPHLKNESEVENAAISRGKMTPRKKSRYSRGLKLGASKHRRQALKRGEYNQKSQFGSEGHSSWWD
jgi:hypothetical protein